MIHALVKCCKKSWFIHPWFGWIVVAKPSPKSKVYRLVNTQSSCWVAATNFKGDKNLILDIFIFFFVQFTQFSFIPRQYLRYPCPTFLYCAMNTIINITYFHKIWIKGLIGWGWVCYYDVDPVTEWPSNVAITPSWLTERHLCQQIIPQFQLDFELRATDIPWDERFREL